MYKFICLVACLAVASAQVLRQAADDEYDPNPSYSFSYDVQDPVTGDVKSQSESRQGDSVQGSYTLVEADGSRRIVEYNADAANGFNAVVHKEALGAARVAAPKPVQIVARAPIPVARAPIALARAPIASAPALVHSSFSAPYATYAF
ncbi:hypothetical protein O3M35_002713 [Rhynocoris fuscipes]|uniref:Cuticle protein n=1 Tax=Rhynocoris fuscipes TaxID=488301 RepID=A0AAW1CTW2_9HEMI